jgi:hypothetical protein
MLSHWAVYLCGRLTEFYEKHAGNYRSSKKWPDEQADFRVFSVLEPSEGFELTEAPRCENRSW